MQYIHGVGHFHPERILDNAFLEALDIGVDANWIIDRVGIHSRRTVLPLDYIWQTRNQDPREADDAAEFSNAVTGANAARMAMARAGVTSEDIGMVISGGCSPQHAIPAEAAVIAAELNIDAPAFDISCACSSFGAQLHFIDGMKAEALPRFVLVVNTENNTRTVDYNDRRTAVLWGDASSAAVISKVERGSWVFNCGELFTDPKGWDLVKTKRGRHFQQNGSAVQKFAISKSVAMLGDLAQQMGDQIEDAYFIGHQGNLRLLNSVCKRSGIREDRHLYNVDQFGNGGAAGAPSVLSQNWDRFNQGDTITMVTVGSGLTWTSFLLEKISMNR